MEMSTVAASRTPASTASTKTFAGSSDRLFYSGMAIVMAALVFSGFAPTYFFRLFGGGPSSTVSGGAFTPLVHVHGALFTAWVLLFVVQTALVAGHRVAVHRRLGLAGAGLAAAMILVGTSTAIATARRAAHQSAWTPWPSSPSPSST
jgi:hypothetical protein